MGDWDDESESEEEGAGAGAVGFTQHAGGGQFDEDFGGSRVTNSAFDGEDEDDDAADAWDDSEEEPEPEGETGPVKTRKEVTVEQKARKEARMKAALRDERLLLARRAGRFEAADAAKKAASLTGIIGEDGIERRTDPSDGNHYTIEEFAEAYGPQAEELWAVAVQMMHEGDEPEASSGLGDVQADSDTLFGDDGDFYGDNDDEPDGGKQSASLETCLMHQLINTDEYTAAADVIVNKFEQLIVSDNFVGFFGKFLTSMLSEQKTNDVGDVVTALSRMQKSKSKATSWTAVK